MSGSTSSRKAVRGARLSLSEHATSHENMHQVVLGLFTRPMSMSLNQALAFQQLAAAMPTQSCDDMSPACNDPPMCMRMPRTTTMHQQIQDARYNQEARE